MDHGVQMVETSMSGVFIRDSSQHVAHPVVAGQPSALPPPSSMQLAPVPAVPSVPYAPGSAVAPTDRIRPASALSPPSHLTDSGFAFEYVEREEEILLFVEPPSRNLHCPLCKKIFRDPVITTCGHTFCKGCVGKSEEELCPIDLKLSRFIVANIALSEQIGELRVHCRYGVQPTSCGGSSYEVNPGGCPVKLKYSEKSQHERDCPYQPVECPNNPDCPTYLKKDLEAHLVNCRNVPCVHASYGCTFRGTVHTIQEHLASCKYENVKEFLHKTDTKINELTKAVKSKSEDIDFLRTSLSQLSIRVEQLENGLHDREESILYLQTELEEAKKSQALTQVDVQKLIDMAQSNYHPPLDPQAIIKCKGTFVGHEGPIWALCADLNYLFSASSDLTVKVWDTTTNYKCVKTLEGHTGLVLALCTSGKMLYSSSNDHKVIAWNMDTFTMEKMLEAHTSPVCALAASRGFVFSGSLRIVKVWNTQDHTLVRSLEGFNHWIRALRATEKELYCGSFQTIRIYDLETFEVLRELGTSGGSVYSLCLTDKHILCGTFENLIHVWEIDNKSEQAFTLAGHSGTVYALVSMNCPSGQVVFSASHDRSIRVWSMDNMICRQALVRHTGQVTSLATSKGRLFSGAVDSSVKVWQ